MIDYEKAISELLRKTLPKRLAGRCMDLPPYEEWLRGGNFYRGGVWKILLTRKIKVYNEVAYFLFSFYGDDTIYCGSYTRGRGSSGTLLDPGYTEAEEKKI